MLSISHILLLLAIVLILFGAGKLPRVMGDLAKGMRAFKDGLQDEEESLQRPAVVKASASSRSRRKSPPVRR